MLLADQAFLLEVGAGAARQFVEIDQVGIELRPIDAGEGDLIPHGDAAAAAHAGPVHHDGIDGGVSLHPPFAGERGGGQPGRAGENRDPSPASSSGRSDRNL